MRNLTSCRNRWAGILVCLILMAAPPAPANTKDMPFRPGERLEYELRWENVPAGSASLEVRAIKTLKGEKVYHFVLHAKSNKFVDIFYKVRDRIDAYADLEMTRSVHYQKKQREGRHRREEVVDFNWDRNQAHYSNFGKPGRSIQLMDGSFDPLSAFYYSRTINTDIGNQVERPITDGKKNVVGRLKVIRRETITLKNGQPYDTYLVEPEMNHVGGVFKKSKGARIYIWVSADERRIPVRIKSKVIVGHFIGELIGVQSARN